MAEKEYILFCDESDKDGKFFSCFYGGLIVGATQYQRVTDRLNAFKLSLNLFGEVKWSKVTERYLGKYKELVAAFFEEIAAGHVKVRIMFHQNAQRPVGLSPEQLDGRYYLLYYQFIKHAFGIEHIVPREGGTRLRLYFDQFPDTGRQVEEFKNFLHGLEQSPGYKSAGVLISREDITEVRSHEHVLLQCLDIVLGSMTFRLNDKHREKPPGCHRRAKRTRAKEDLYKCILALIRQIKPNFNIGISTGGGGVGGRWSAHYQHWAFKPHGAEYVKALTKRGANKAQ